jgi:hypothetical protein
MASLLANGSKIRRLLSRLMPTAAASMTGSGFAL